MTTVLVIDDDQIIVDLLKMVVEDAGHEVVIASAMDRIPQQIAPDLILTDLIPLKSYRRDLAQEWIRDLRSRYPRIPIVVVTAHTAVDWGRLYERAALVVDTVDSSRGHALRDRQVLRLGAGWSAA